ncbi:MAG: GTPase HflX [Candidatus Omnitrophota bacterium]
MEKAVLVTIDWGKEKNWTSSDLASELRELVRSSGAGILDEIICHRETPTPAYLIGKGKAHEIAERAEAANADVVIFNEDLSFIQQRNLEEIVKRKVIDRSQLILDIFAQRAHSTEGKLQVELAQLFYMLPRLTGKGILLSRLGGGIGTMGPGEKKLEVDRRRIRKRIGKLEEDLESVKRRRHTMRKSRVRHSVSSVALVGYTNVGKTTLLNALTHAAGYTDNRLFATLDPLARRVVLANNQKVVFIDTVGFLHRLPHHLVDAFKATLEEVVQADILVHVLDISHPKVTQQSEAVHKVLTELGAENKPLINALNKIDSVDENTVNRFLRNIRNPVAISAIKKTGIDSLMARVMAELSDLVLRIEITIPTQKMGLLSRVYDEGRVIKKEYTPQGVYIEAEVPAGVKYLLEREGLIFP